MRHECLFFGALLERRKVVVACHQEVGDEEVLLELRTPRRKRRKHHTEMFNTVPLVGPRLGVSLG